jgi:hypothetical protein
VAIPAIIADVEEVEVVVADHERATIRVGNVFLKIDTDQTRTDVEVESPRPAVDRVAGGVGRGRCRRTDAARRATAAMARSEP